MLARSNFRHNAACRDMERDLGDSHERAHRTTVVDDGGGALIAGCFDAEDAHVAGV